MPHAHPRETPRPRELPVGYHLAHFREMLTFVERVYGPILADEHLQWLADFHALPPEAQSLFVRIANRKGKVFRLEHLNYDDVPDRDRAIAALGRTGFASKLREADFDAALGILPKPDLLVALTEAEQDIRKSWTRARLAEAARLHLGFSACFSDSACDTFIVQRRRHSLRYLLYLYFGRIEESLTRFALRDLGLVRTHSFRDGFDARFETRDEAERSFFFADSLASLPDLKDDATIRLAATANEWPPAENAVATLRDTLIYELGRRLERAGETNTARRLYPLGTSAECGERAVRLAYTAGERNEVHQRLEAMIADPATDGEALFAQDFLERKFNGKRTSVITDMLRAAETIGIDESSRASPERGAITLFERRGWTAQHTENTPWRTLFGLLFWDELYGGDAATLHNAFERMPQALNNRSFYAMHRAAIDRKLERLDDSTATLTGLLRTFSAEHDTPNALFRWHEDMIEGLKPLLSFAPPSGLATVMREMAQNYPQRKDGFPDLMLSREGELRFIEIKTENDQLRRNQLAQLLLLQSAGFSVAINRVKWIVDPDQIYVVVDIETTGGRASAHRVTEIGAVKMRDGEVIDRWQSLVNPERPIPATITRLTGITDAMVADAPVFADIADDFSAFMGDAIFVAHNVRFDYGFLSAEYQRLERRFRYPTLCTCQSMRSLWKGLPSYGLANLCRHFEIPLDSHHRALCDAEAAAELLKLINERRISAQVPEHRPDTRLSRPTVGTAQHPLPSSAHGGNREE